MFARGDQIFNGFAPLWRKVRSLPYINSIQSNFLVQIRIYSNWKFETQISAGNFVRMGFFFTTSPISSSKIIFSFDDIDYIYWPKSNPGALRAGALRDVPAQLLPTAFPVWLFLSAAKKAKKTTNKKSQPNKKIKQHQNQTKPKKQPNKRQPTKQKIPNHTLDEKEKITQHPEKAPTANLPPSSSVQCWDFHSLKHHFI